MTESSSPGHPRAGAQTSGRQSNGVRSDNYSSPNGRDNPDDVNTYDQELVTSPGHGAVGVFQSPQPVRPRGGPVADSAFDIDSPFLDLFGGTSAPVVLLLSTYDEDAGARFIAECGAAAYVTKSAFGPERLREAWTAATT